MGQKNRYHCLTMDARSFSRLVEFIGIARSRYNRLAPISDSTAGRDVNCDVFMSDVLKANRGQTRVERRIKVSCKNAQFSTNWLTRH